VINRANFGWRRFITQAPHKTVDNGLLRQSIHPKNVNSTLLLSLQRPNHFSSAMKKKQRRAEIRRQFLF
jgi:hypothetical protein